MKPKRDIISELLRSRGKGDVGESRSHGVGWTGLSSADRGARGDEGEAQLGVGWTGRAAEPRGGLPKLGILVLWPYNLLDPSSLPSLGLEHLLVQRD